MSIRRSDMACVSRAKKIHKPTLIHHAMMILLARLPSPPMVRSLGMVPVSFRSIRIRQLLIGVIGGRGMPASARPRRVSLAWAESVVMARPRVIIWMRQWGIGARVMGGPSGRHARRIRMMMKAVLKIHHCRPRPGSQPSCSRRRGCQPYLDNTGWIDDRGRDCRG